MNLGPSSGGADAQGEAALLNILANPVALAERLKSLADKSKEAETFAQQAKVENQKMELSRAEAESLNASTMEMVRQIAFKEDDLRAREEGLAQQRLMITGAEQKLDDAKAAFNAQASKTQAELDAREHALAAAVLAQEQSSKQAVSDAERAVTERLREIDLGFKNRLESIGLREQELDATEARLKQALKEAADLKSQYETRLNNLRNLVT